MAKKKASQKITKEEKTATKEKMSPLVELAHKAVEEYVKHGEALVSPKDLTPEMKEKAGVFVSIHERGDLRGCIGTFEPCYPNVAEEIIHNAILAASEDPRFPPVESQELELLDISVDVLTPPERVKSEKELNPKKYGVIVGCGYRRGLLLPDLEGVETAQEQINICRMKGGIGPQEEIDLYRFQVKRHR